MPLPARLYLDHAATSPLRPEARRAIEACWSDDLGNAASGHAEGRRARALLEDARARVAALAGARPDEVVFTSGATEAANLAIRGALRAARPERRALVTTPIEHAATRRSVERVAEQGARVTLLEVDRFGRVEPAALDRALGRQPVLLVTLLAGHNELGTVQRLGELTERAHARGALVHLDAAQALSTVELGGVPWDLLSLSGHKLGGPQGIGALVVRAPEALLPLLAGGPQERGLRPGTVPIALAVGLGAAAEVAAAVRRTEAARLRALRDRLGRRLLERLTQVGPLGPWHEAPDEALAQVLPLGVGGLRGDELVQALDELGVAASSAAACSGDLRSHVLDAVGLAPDVGLLRLSLGWSSAADLVDDAVERVAQAIATLRAQRPFERRRRLVAARAAEAGVTLVAAHWDVLEATHDFHLEHGVLPGPRALAARTGAPLDLERLFPDGLRAVATWLGLPVPQGGCRPAGL